jgi:hypothetical protein
VNWFWRPSNKVKSIPVDFIRGHKNTEYAPHITLLSRNQDYFSTEELSAAFETYLVWKNFHRAMIDLVISPEVRTTTLELIKRVWIGRTQDVMALADAVAFLRWIDGVISRPRKKTYERILESRQIHLQAGAWSEDNEVTYRQISYASKESIDLVLQNFELKVASRCDPLTWRMMQEKYIPTILSSLVKQKASDEMVAHLLNLVSNKSSVDIVDFAGVYGRYKEEKSDDVFDTK